MGPLGDLAPIFMQALKPQIGRFLQTPLQIDSHRFSLGDLIKGNTGLPSLPSLNMPVGKFMKLGQSLINNIGQSPDFQQIMKKPLVIGGKPFGSFRQGLSALPQIFASQISQNMVPQLIQSVTNGDVSPQVMNTFGSLINNPSKLQSLLPLVADFQVPSTDGQSFPMMQVAPQLMNGFTQRLQPLMGQTIDLGGGRPQTFSDLFKSGHVPVQHTGHIMKQISPMVGPFMQSPLDLGNGHQTNLQLILSRLIQHLFNKAIVSAQPQWDLFINNVNQVAEEFSQLTAVIVDCVQKEMSKHNFSQLSAKTESSFGGFMSSVFKNFGLSGLSNLMPSGLGNFIGGQ